jgi:hypothetical protein
MDFPVVIVIPSVGFSPEKKIFAIHGFSQFTVSIIGKILV